MASVPDQTQLAEYRWQLFMSVRPIFASEIPWIPSHEATDPPEHRPSLDLACKLIGPYIKALAAEMPAHLPPGNLLDSSLLISISNDLRTLLLALQQLVDDKIETLVDTTKVNVIDPQYSKLDTLTQLLRASTTDPVNNDSHLKYIKLEQRPVQLTDTVNAMKGFNERWLLKLSSSSRTSATSSSELSTATVSEKGLSWLQTKFHPSFWASSSNLFKALVRELEKCHSQPQTEAFLNLNGLCHLEQLRDKQAEFEILIRSCRFPDSLQVTSCRGFYHELSKSDADDQFEKLCDAVGCAVDYGGTLHFHEHAENCWYGRCGVQCYPKRPQAVPVSKLLESGYLSSLGTICRKDKFLLALKLAQSLLRLHDSPWLQRVWTSDNLLFLCEESEQKNKFRLCSTDSLLVSCVVSTKAPPPPAGFRYDTYPLILTFGQLLLELVNGRKLPIQRTGGSNEFSPHLTLEASLKDAGNFKDVSKNYKAAVHGCFNFYNKVQNLKRAARSQDQVEESLRISAIIFEDIVLPLERNLQAWLAYLQSSSSDDKGMGNDTDGLWKNIGPNELHLSDFAFQTRSQTSTSIQLLEGSTGNVVASRSRSDLVIAADISAPATHPPTTTQAINIVSSSHAPIQHQRAQQSLDESEDTSHTESDTDVDEGSTEGSDEERTESGRLFGKFDAAFEDDAKRHATSLEFGKTFRNLSRTHRERLGYDPGDKVVKVAILDTGLDESHPDFAFARSRPQKSGIKPVGSEPTQRSRIKGRNNLCDDGDAGDVTDVDGHGTHVAGIILQLAPRAELYIARVCQGNRTYGKHGSDGNRASAEPMTQSSESGKVDPSRVEKAVKWAIEQGVDLINMSFGYTSEDIELKKVLEDARDKGIIILAAASNDGAHSGIAWPANDPGVAICVHASQDLGRNCSGFTPRPEPEPLLNFMVVGENVWSHWPVFKGGGFRTMSGTSTATPVATAIAALLLAFMQQSSPQPAKKRELEDEIGPILEKKIRGSRRLDRMKALLQHISEKEQKYYWIPGTLLWSNYDPRREDVKDPRKASDHAWEQIRKALKKSA